MIRCFVRMEHLECFANVLLFPLPGVADNAPIGRGTDAATNPKHAVHRRPEMPTSVPAEHKSVEVSIDKLLPEPVERA